MLAFLKSYATPTGPARRVGEEEAGNDITNAPGRVMNRTGSGQQGSEGEVALHIWLQNDRHCSGWDVSFLLLSWFDFQTIVLHILLCLLIFYTVYYMTGSICCGAFRLNNFGMLIPFEFNMEPSYSNPNYLANVLSMETTFLISGLLFAVLLKRWVWDYTITVTMAHVLLTVAVMKEFPLVWQWWLALASGLFIMICSGELVTYLACSNTDSLL
ncbi:transmembrane protein 244-like [Lacerta agilis]|uniref:transmembrane protein 244-like n=1 Tax=Lacerta agilis TaxID=80427 RepID=UPI001419FC01|nr:transmembrane protein 244-like [Lacerta agilis]